VLGIALLAGCHDPIGQNTFTSAAPNGRGLFDEYLPTAPGRDTPTDGEGEAPREVVEPDVIRKAGSLLYVLNQHRGLLIVDLDAGTVLSQSPAYGFPRDLYLVGNRAYVLVSYAANTRVTDELVAIDLSSRLFVFDVANPTAPLQLAAFDLAGDLIDSRLVGEVLYAVSAEYQWYWPEDDGTVSSGGPRITKQQTSASWVTSIAVGDPNNIRQVDTQSLAGYGNLIQATAEAIFVAAPDGNTNQTGITYVDIANPAGAIVVRGSVSVPGTVPDRFKMDAYDGVLRVVSTTWWPERKVHLTTVDLGNPDNLQVLGETDIEGARGETLFATRFDGPRAYVVTYFIVDPLFVLDLSDPTAPKVTGVLEVPGWSTHIEPRGDRLLALGVDDTGGTRRVSMSLFDVRDPAAPGLLDRVSFGADWSWSSAYEDVKALGVLGDLILVPFSGWSSDAGGFERLQLVTWNGDALKLEGYVDLEGQIKRSLAHGPDYFAVTTEELARIDADDRANPRVTQRVTLAENVTDYQEINPGLGAVIISRWDTADTLVRTVDGSGNPLGEVVVAAANLSASFVHGQQLILVSTGWDEEGYYLVFVVDCANPAAPRIARQFKVNISPYWGWWWDGGPVPMKDMRPWGPWWWTPGDIAFLVGDTLALRGYADRYDVVLGNGAPETGLALVDLAEGRVRTTLGLAIKDIQVMQAIAGRLYISNIEQTGSDALGRAIAAYYIRALDPAAPSLGPAANVPGALVQYDPASGVLVCEDLQYANFMATERSLASVSWSGGDTATLIDREAVPQSAGTLLGRGTRIVFQQYDGTSKISSIRIASNGALSPGTAFAVSDLWASLIDATDTHAYAALGGYAVVVYALDEGSLAQLSPVMATPWRIRFGAQAAMAPLGYAGLLRMEYPTEN
jgi:hypothetical protein